jgi:uncharacterized protein YkwD
VQEIKLDQKLCVAAEIHAGWMQATQQLSHTGDKGSSHSDRIKKAGYLPKASGENIAMGYSSVAAVMSGWLGSSGHRRNIVNSSYMHCGFGMVADSRGRKWWVAVFARPKISKFEEEIFSGDSLPPGIISGEIDDAV